MKKIKLKGHSRRFMNKSLFRSIVLLLLVAALLFLAVIRIDPIFSAVGQVLGVLSPLFAGILIALVLERPFVLFRDLFLKLCKKAKRKYRLASAFSIAVTYLLLVAFLVAFLYLVIPGIVSSISSLLANLGGYAENVENAVNGLREKNEFFRQHIEPLDLSAWEAYLSEILKNLGTYLSNSLPEIFNITKSIVGVITDTVLALIISIYILFDFRHLIWQAKKVVYAFFPKEAADRIGEIAKLSTGMFTNYISGRIADSAIIGVLCFICMNIFGFEYATLISVIVGVTNIIPVFGPFIGAIPSALLLLLVNPKDCFWFIIFIIILQQLDGNVIGPKITGESTGLPSLWVVIAITVGGGLFGMLGLLLGVPFCAVVYSLLRKHTVSNAKKKQIPLDDVPESDPPKQHRKLLQAGYERLKKQITTRRKKEK